MKQIFFIYFLVAIFGCLSHKNKQAESKVIHGLNTCGSNYQVVSFIELKNSASKYEGIFVEVEGFYQWGTEENAISSNSNSENKKGMIWVSFTEQVAKSIEENNLEENNPFQNMKGKKIKIRGIVKSNEHGHLGQYLTSVEYICYLEVYDSF